jgi:hypothetical protein
MLSRTENLYFDIVVGCCPKYDLTLSRTCLDFGRLAQFLLSGALMKQNRILNWLVACGVALMMVTSLSAQTSRERTATVVRLKGAARYSNGDNVWQPIKVGTILKSGALIQTAAKSYVDIVLGDSDQSPARGGGGAGTGSGVSYKPKAEQDVVRISQDTVLALDRLTVLDTGADQITETQLDLRSGKIFGTVKKLAPTSRYEIKLPNGVAGVRGTIYTISSDGVVQVLVGSVVISWIAPDGTQMTQTVNGGYQFDARTGLVTPIPDFDQKEMVRFAKENRIGPNTPPKTFVQDQTVYYVSPVQGHNGNSSGD